MKEKLLVFIPAYNCSSQIGRVLDQVEAGWVQQAVAQVIVIDNLSTDKTLACVAHRIRARSDDYIQLLRNDLNYGLGGSHKVAFQYALEHGFDWLVVLHGDDQGKIEDFRELIEGRRPEGVDAFLGSRFMQGSRCYGYSYLRICGNYIFNKIYSLCLGQRILDLGAGLNLYRVSALRFGDIVRFPDNLTFNCVMLCSQVLSGDVLRFVPISWREDDQVSNVKLLRQSFQTLRIALSAALRQSKFASREHRDKIISTYSWKVIDV